MIEHQVLTISESRNIVRAAMADTARDELEDGERIRERIADYLEIEAEEVDDELVRQLCMLGGTATVKVVFAR